MLRQQARSFAVARKTINQVFENGHALRIANAQILSCPCPQLLRLIAQLLPGNGNIRQRERVERKMKFVVARQDDAEVVAVRGNNRRVSKRDDASLSTAFAPGGMHESVFRNPVPVFVERFESQLRV